MQGEPKAKVPGWIALCLLLVGAAAMWWGLDRWERRPVWLSVEAPRRAVAGKALPLHVHLAPLLEPTRLCADLHWSNTRDTSMGYLSTGGSQAVGTEGGTFDFEIGIPPKKGVRFVTGILFLSRTCNWEDHTLVAATDLIPVTKNMAEQEETRLETLRLQPPGDATAAHIRPAATPRWLTALLFLIAAVAARRGGPSAIRSASEQGDGNRRWQALAVAMALACLWEFFGLESWLGAQARAMARAEDFYYPRAVFQKLVISATIAATVLFLHFIRRVNGSHRLLLASFGLYLAISGVNLVSWHPIDRVADLAWHGLTLVQALKLGCAALTLVPYAKNAARGAQPL
jgi:hypothetical protein